jgi:hypothetical protein
MRFFLALVALLAALPARATPPCDPGLQGVPDPATAYRLRDARRCEGFYISPVSRPGSLRLVSLTRGVLRFSAQDQQVALRLPDTGGAAP